MIDPIREEQAALHVLGALTPQEATEFKAALKTDPELYAFVARLTPVTGALAGAVPRREPPPQLRDRVLAQVAPAPTPAVRPERSAGFGFWLPWAFAAGLAVVCLMLFTQDTRLRRQVGDQTAQIRSLNQLAAALQASTNQLQQTVLALQATNLLANLRIAMLNSQLADSPQAVGVTLWDAQKQAGIFVVQHLRQLPPGRDYQLWVLDPGNPAPVSAGVFQVSDQGTVRVDFKADKTIQTAGKFAVTEEPKGGLPAPTLKNLVLIGG